MEERDFSTILLVRFEELNNFLIYVVHNPNKFSK